VDFASRQLYLREQVQLARGEVHLKVDCLLRPTAVNTELVRLIDRVGPYGAGNPQPVFAFDNMRIDYAERLRGGHVRCAFADSEGIRLNAICFNAEENGLSEILLSKEPGKVHVAGRIKQDSWKGRTKIDLQIVDVAKA